MIPVSGGRLNRNIGWVLLVAGFAYATWLDPCSLSERGSSCLAGGPKIAARHAQTMVVGMGLLQLAASRMLAATSLLPLAYGISVWLTGLGGVVSAIGYGMTGRWASSAWLILAGALMNLTGFMIIARGGPGRGRKRQFSVVLAIICSGMVLDAVMGTSELSSRLFLPSYIGAEDGLRLRMLRLARVSAIVLPVLTLLHQGLAEHADPRTRSVRWGRIGMLCGTIGIPVILTIAGFMNFGFKLLLPIPANAIFIGTLCGAWLAKRHARPLELWGWLLIAVSIAAGLVIGLFAFDGPLPPPGFVGGYNDVVRTLIRLAHTYCIVFGLASIFVSRDLEERRQADWPARVGRPLLVAGSVTSVVVILLLTGVELPASVLSVGPVLVTVATVSCVVPSLTRA